MKLLGKVIRHRLQHPVYGCHWLAAKIIEVEAYYLTERGSHSSLGFTEKRAAMFMPPGTVYMYYARGGDSLNFSAAGEGNAVLVKSGICHVDTQSPEETVHIMQQLNPINGRLRRVNRQCSGQTLLCRSLGLRVPDWDKQQLSPENLVVDDIGIELPEIVQCRRLGIAEDRDAHLPYRFVDPNHLESATKNPWRDPEAQLIRVD